ncbi:serine/threonine-protein kinase [Streptomyces diacarni]|uniref:serine/threonine-protein kinase n=1 Tax=Streptomyces diacarni TaxID=2800381 RepID=UPI001FE6A9D2|nr:serine/threonine-protein kinase [Streptomyces diacarni]
MAGFVERATVGPLLEQDPEEIGGYLLRGRIGSGGMGTVYLSETRGGLPVALKRVKPELAADPMFRRRFEQEVRASRRVRGQYIVPLLDANTDGDVPWLATEYVPGCALAPFVARNGPLPPAAAVRLTAGIAQALATIHAADVIHRDLKPGNVLLTDDGPAIIDFGIARAADATALTGTDVHLGTPAFMAPEQIKGGASVLPATDVFALGLTVYVAATGAHPFGTGPHPVVFYRIVNEQPDLSACPAQLEELLALCLNKDPAARPSPSEIVARCQNIGADKGLRAILPTTGWLPDATGTTEPGSLATSPTATAEPPVPTRGDPPTRNLTFPAAQPTGPRSPGRPGAAGSPGDEEPGSPLRKSFRREAALAAVAVVAVLSVVVLTVYGRNISASGSPSDTPSSGRSSAADGKEGGSSSTPSAVPSGKPSIEITDTSSRWSTTCSCYTVSAKVEVYFPERSAVRAQWNAAQEGSGPTLKHEQEISVRAGRHKELQYLFQTDDCNRSYEFWADDTRYNAGSHADYPEVRDMVVVPVPCR